MSRRIVSLTTLSLFLTASTTRAAVTMSFSDVPPTVGLNSQAQMADDATIPGGTTPGGGTYNSQAYTDNVGPPGQTFTTPATGPFFMTSLSVKSVGDAGGGVFTAGNTFSLRISSVSGTTLTPIMTATAFPTLAGQSTTAVGWLTFNLTGAERPTLGSNTQYAWEVFSSSGWFGIDATQSDAAYAGGTAFNSAGPARSFTDNTTGNLANHGYDRTFHVGLRAIPEPAAGLLAAFGLAGWHIVRRRR
jgi:hypothetical protein